MGEPVVPPCGALFRGGRRTTAPTATKARLRLSASTMLDAAEVAELADAPDSKSGSLRGVWVRFPPSALISEAASCLKKRSVTLESRGRAAQTREKNLGPNHACDRVGGAKGAPNGSDRLCVPVPTKPE